MSKQTTNDTNSTREARIAIKRSRGSESDTESEFDEANGNISTSLAHLDGEVPEYKHGTPKSESVDMGATTFLSFDWESEEPYKKAVDRYASLVIIAWLSLYYYYYFASVRLPCLVGDDLLALVFNF